MFRLLSPLPILAFLLAAPLSAAPRPGERAEGPPIIGQAKSLHDLLEMTKTLVKNVAGAELNKEFEAHVLPDLDFGKLPGIDPKRPFGLYGTIDADLAKCRVVVLIPVTGEKQFLDMLQQFEIPVNKGKDPGTFDFVTPPDVPFPLSGRIHKEYAYIAVGGADVIEPKVIIDPKDVINEKEKAVAYLALKLDRVPPETKKNLVGLLRQHTEQLAEGIREPELKAAFTAARNLGFRWLRLLAEETKEIALRLDADTKNGDLTLEFTLDPNSKSPLAEAIAKRKPTQNAFASIAGPDTVQRMFITAPLFADEAKEAWVKLIEFGESDLAKNPPPPEVEGLVKAVLKSLKANVESGNMDLAVAIRGPNKDGFYNVVGAVHCKEGAQLEKAIKEGVKGLGQAAGYFKFDAAKVSGLSVHEIDLTSEAQDIAKAVFGNGNKGYFAFGKDALYAAYGPDAMTLIKEAIEAKPGPAAVFDSSSDPKKATELMKKIIPPDNPNVARQVRWLGLGASEAGALGGLKVTVDGGDKLKIRATVNTGMLIRMGLGFFASEAKPAPGPAVAVPVAPPAVKKE
jgi:hypothetical protein